MAKPTIKQLQERIKYLEKICQEQADQAANPPQRKLTLAEETMQAIANHEASIVRLQQVSATLQLDVNQVQKQIRFHTNIVATLKEGLGHL